MKILLVNANTFVSPPAPPAGVEYVASALERRGHETEVFDMCFRESPLDELSVAAARGGCDFAGVSFRNIDTCQAARYANFAPELAETVRVLHEAGLKVALGGSGFSGMAEAIMQFTGADYVIVGPGELAFARLCDEFDPAAQQPDDPAARLVNGWRLGIEPDAVPRRAEHVDYRQYMESGGIAGFATHFGCPERCHYCIEAGTPVHYRSPAAVAAEIRAMAAKGIDHFHLCDSEFNTNPARALDLLRLIENARLDIRWTAYMKPAPWPRELTGALRRGGVYLVTLSVDSAAASAPGGRYDYEQIAGIVRSCKKHGIKLAIDLTLGAPGEPAESVRSAIEFFRRERPDSVNANAWFRVYGGTRLEKLLRSEPALHKFLSMPLPPHQPLLEPVFYNQLPLDELKRMIDGDPVFKLEGFDPGTNYEVISEKMKLRVTSDE